MPFLPWKTRAWRPASSKVRRGRPAKLTCALCWPSAHPIVCGLAVADTLQAVPWLHVYVLRNLSHSSLASQDLVFHRGGDGHVEWKPRHAGACFGWMYINCADGHGAEGSMRGDEVSLSTSYPRKRPASVSGNLEIPLRCLSSLGKWSSRHPASDDDYCGEGTKLKREKAGVGRVCFCRGGYSHTQLWG